MEKGERVRRLELLLKICQSLSTMLEPEAVLHEVVKAAVQLTDSEAASILLYDEETNQLHFAATTSEHWEHLKHQIVPLRGSVAGKAMIQRKPQLVEHVPSSLQHFRRRDESPNFVTRNAIAVPLEREAVPLGVLEVLNKRGGPFDEDDAEILLVLASQAAVVLHNARLIAAAQRSYKELQKIDRMKSDFVAIASHELRTPLGIILGYATHLQEIITDPFKDSMAAILRAANRLKELVEELSHLENYQQGEAVMRLQETDVGALLREIVADFQYQAQLRQLHLTLRLPSEETVAAKVDQEKLAIAVRHVLRNAITFTDSGGKISVRLEKHQNYFQITVADTGVGIPAADLPHIFERFYQAEKHLTRRHGGLGLGLAIAKSMVEIHGGAIWAESEEDEGTTVVMWIPVSPPDQQTQLHTVLAT